MGSSISPFYLGSARVLFDSTSLPFLTKYHIHLHPLTNNDGETYKKCNRKMYDLGVSNAQKRKASQDRYCVR